MSKTYTYNHCPVNGVTVATIEDKKNNIVVIGKAFCHPKDRDYCSELTGTHIAHQRAEIKYCHVRIVQLKKEKRPFENFYKNLAQSKHFNKHSYEARQLRKKIYQFDDEIEFYKEYAKKLEEDVETYINKKQFLYTKLRKNGQKKQK